MKSRAGLALGAALLLAFAMIPHATGQTSASDTVFRIGKFDRSSWEFNREHPKRPVTFRTGSSIALTNWHATQPARLESKSGSERRNSGYGPATIEFNISGTPRPTYTLHVALLEESPAVPALEVKINGRCGRFYPQPVLDRELGDRIAQNDSAYSHADVIFTFPGSYLHQGKNILSLEAIEESPDPSPKATFTYDAIELATGAPDQGPSAQIVPTIFYRQKDGKLTEDIEIILRSAGRMAPGSGVDLTIGADSYHRTLAAGRDFGEEAIEFDVAEFPAASRAVLKWTDGEHLQTQEESITPARKWTLYLVPQVHLDIGFTDYQAKVAASQSRALNEAMDLIAQHPSFRFSTDGQWNVEQFIKTRTPEDQKRLVDSVKRRELFVPAQYAELLTGFPTAETLIRSLYAGASFSREHGTPFEYANITDVPSYSWSYASILASAGIKYFIAASNNHRAPVLMQGLLDEKSPYYWEGPDGKKVLMWYSRHYSQMKYLFDLPNHLSAGRETIPLYLQAYNKPQYRANAVLIYGSQGENTDLFPQQAVLAERWNGIYAYPHLEYSGFQDALTSIASQFGDKIQTVRGDGGPYWELGIGSDAYFAAIERRNESRGPSAEKLATLSSLVQPGVAADKADLDEMWKEMVLMDEHTWTSSSSVKSPESATAVSQLTYKDAHATRAAALVDFVSQSSMATLSDSISTPAGSLIVFNTLNWARTGPVLFDLGRDREIVDPSTGRVVPGEILRESPGKRSVRFVAQDVPAMGYKVFKLRNAAATGPVPDARQISRLESPFYRVELDPATGSIRSIYDKQLRRELVNQQSPYRFGQYLYVTGGDRDATGEMLQSWYRPQPKLEIHPAGDGRVLSLRRTPEGSVARLQSRGLNTPEILTEIRLFDREKKIEIVETVNKKEVTSVESVYFAFPFAMQHPRFQYEIQTGVVDPARDMYPGAGREWFSVQHWAAVEQDGLSAAVMPLDVPLITFGDINRDAWPTQFGDRTGTIFSYAMNNLWEDNYRASQGGSFRFRYVITSAPSTDASALSRMGWEEMTPFEANELRSQEKAVDTPRALSGERYSFMEIPDDRILVQAWKPAEDGNGTVLRLLDLGGSARAVTIRLPLVPLQQVWQTDAVERNQKRILLKSSKEFELNIHPNEIVTVRLITGEKVGTL